jgi:hypothetical protein
MCRLQSVCDLDPELRCIADLERLTSMRVRAFAHRADSMTMNGWPPSCSMACTVQMPGWLSAEAARASRLEALEHGPSCASLGGKELDGDTAAEWRSSAS